MTGPAPPEGPAAWAPETRRVVALLGERPWSGDFYLAGTAALAAHLNHRPAGSVRSLDLMAAGWTLRSPQRRDLMADLLPVASVEVETARDGFLSLRFPDPGGGSVAAKLFHYPYPVLEEPTIRHGLAVASLLDLGLMKLGAVISRAARRDFVDLYLLCRRLPLETLLERSPEKFPQVRDFPLQALKGLADTRAAEDDPMPRFAEEVEAPWEAVLEWIDGEVRQVARRRVGLSAE